MSTQLDKDQTLAALPPEWPHALLKPIRRATRAGGSKVVVLDDDPTGTQTVYNIAVLTEWSTDVLAAELARETPGFYILTNSRSMPLDAAQELNREIARNLQAAAAAVGREFTVVSRSDSTLRGHYPGEVDALLQALGQRVDACLLIPFFLEGGRLTINDVHYVVEDDRLVPAAETPFAKDAAFGYRSSNLREWVVEKTEGQIGAGEVFSVSLADIRRGGPEKVAERLLRLPQGSVCVVNSVSLRDQEVFVLGLLQAESQGKSFVYRTAASFVQIRLGLETQPLLTAQALRMEEADRADTSGGLVVVGSYVPKTTAQLYDLLATDHVVPLEINVRSLLDQTVRAREITRVAGAADESLQNGEDVVVFTSREFVTAADAETILSIGESISSGLVEVVRAIRTRPRYLLAKGGITSSDVATKALEVKRARVRGQILPGVPVWETGDESRYPGLPLIIFPGNVGDDQALTAVVRALRR